MDRSPTCGASMSGSSPAIHPVGLDFLLPYLAPHARFVARPDEADFILAMNSLEPGAAATLADLRRYGRTLFCYQAFMWPAPYRQFWRGERSCRTSAEQYSYGRVVLGLNNQRSGMDGRARTYMTSMRTFEALACGKPFLASHSDAYARLGF